MITAEILQHFCANAPERLQIARPWVESWGGIYTHPAWSWATCGRVIVGVPGVVPHVATGLCIITREMWADLALVDTATKFSEFPPLPPPCFAALDCDDGRTDSAAIPQRVEILGRDFSDVFLRRLRDCLPAAEFAVLGPDHRLDRTPLVGRCSGGGRWICMPILRFGRDGRRLA